ncbi:hypothetical protein B0J11DRAFT_502905 [Dendryphion nanum]|uniref:Uncharacterized protein n=1 Tax=Dendryphion nanum TaxID=256645 RepID=A0A9P9EEQ7_9PLEO|nr:hypothetical protein B0J11DRAFT_502905 [Dendryphion nanum]
MRLYHQICLFLCLLFQATAFDQPGYWPDAPNETTTSTSAMPTRAPDNRRFECNSLGNVCWVSNGTIRLAGQSRDESDQPLKLHPERPNSRCNPDDKSEIQFLVGKEWVTVHTCEVKGSCYDIIGGGACYNPEADIFNFPEIPEGLRDKFTIPEVDEDDKEIDYVLDLENGVYEHGDFQHSSFDTGFPSSIHTEIEVARQYKGPTRCNPETLSETQVFDGLAWITYQKCYIPQSCVNMYGIGVCQVLPQATRCNPVSKNEVQFFNGNDWYTLFKCQGSDKCIDLNGVGACHLKDGTYQLPLEATRDAHLSQRITTDERSHKTLYALLDTRCHPSKPRVVQIWTGDKWKKLGRCPKHSVCMERDGNWNCTFYPQLRSFKDISPGARLCSCYDDAGHDPRQKPSSPIESPPEPLEPPPYVEPNLHSMDSRCNPQNFSEIQIFRKDTWIHAAACQGQTICKDVNGIGACEVGPFQYFIPAFNESTPLDSHIKHPPHKPFTRCNAANNTESQVWSRAGWVLDGVCEPPFECHEFLGVDAHTVCVVPGTVSRTVYLPIPVQDTESSKSDLAHKSRGVEKILTKCEGNTLWGWYNGAWAYQLTCPYGFICGDIPNNSDSSDRQSQPAKKACISHNAREVLTAHFGRPDEWDERSQLDSAAVKARLDQSIPTFSPRYDDMHSRRAVKYDDVSSSQSDPEN